MTNKQTSSVALLNSVTASMSSNKYANAVDQELLEKASFYEVNVELINSLRTNNTDLFTLPVELPKHGSVTLGLYRHNIFTEDLVISNNEGIQSNKDAKRILFYRGAVIGYPNSVVSLTIFNNEISGVVSIDSDNYNLGKLKNLSTHILYDEKVLDQAPDFVCSTPEPDFVEDRPAEVFSPNRTVQCVRFKVEVDNNLASQLGGMTGSINYVAALYNEVLTLFANDNIGANVTEVFVWTSASPYSGSSQDMLYQMSNTSPNADITTLLSNQSSGGIAFLEGLCSGDDSAVNVCNINGFFNNVPTYSWDVMVVAHEAGHNLGSPHTHACAWNGNNTAIDGCGPDAGYSEGCSGSLPPSGGTIMSYCHFSVGINFNFGFGSQPGQRIRNYVDNSFCLGTNCEPLPPTCDDGIQNGNETAIDCGGSDCDACPTCDDGIQNGTETGVDCGGTECNLCPCDGAPVSLNIILDEYPEETSWDIKNSGGTIVESGGTYGSEPDGSLLEISMCLSEGCYTFTIYDTFGDGICCSYGDGSYALVNFDGDALAQGGNFDNSETTNFCVTELDTGTELDIKVLLEGPYDETTNTMNDGLRQSGNLPLDEPFSALGFDVPPASTNLVILNQTGNDAVVDWVLVELRNAIVPSTVLASQAGLVQRDGDIVAADGSALIFEDIIESSVMVAVRHRNHFGVRTNISYSTDDIINIDFSDPATPVYGTSPMNTLGNGLNALITGDANGDGSSNNADKNNYWRIQSGEAYDYSVFRADFNLDGAVNANDKNNHWRLNNGKAEQLD